jgi:hypothetical protein
MRGHLTRHQVCERYGIVSDTLTDWMAERGFPRPSIQHSLRRQFWRESVLDDFDRRVERHGPKPVLRRAEAAPA